MKNKNLLLTHGLLLLVSIGAFAQKVELFSTSELTFYYTVSKEKSNLNDRFWRKTTESTSTEQTKSYQSCVPKEWAFTYTIYVENLTPYYVRFQCDVLPVTECYIRKSDNFSDSQEAIIEPRKNKNFFTLKVSAADDQKAPDINLTGFARLTLDIDQAKQMLKNGAKPNQFRLQDFGTLNSFMIQDLLTLGICPFLIKDTRVYSTPAFLENATRVGFPGPYESDTTISKLKRNANGKLISYNYEIGNFFQESYQEKKGWLLSYVLKMDSVGTTKIGDGYSIKYKGISASSNFDIKGRKIEEMYYEYNGEYIDKLNQLDHYYTWEYYPQGQLKMKWEVKRVKKLKLLEVWDLWNILEYYYPDGKPYTDWGTLKDGVGYYNVLDDNGKICDVCTEDFKKAAAKKEAKKKN